MRRLLALLASRRVRGRGPQKCSGSCPLLWPRLACVVCFTALRDSLLDTNTRLRIYSLHFQNTGGGRGRAGQEERPQLFKATSATRGKANTSTMAAASSRRRLSLLQLVVIPMASCLAFATLPSSSLHHARGQGLSMVRGSPSYGMGARADGGVSSSSSLPRGGSFFLPTRRTQSHLHSSREDEQVHF